MFKTTARLLQVLCLGAIAVTLSAGQATAQACPGCTGRVPTSPTQQVIYSALDLQQVPPGICQSQIRVTIFSSDGECLPYQFSPSGCIEDAPCTFDISIMYSSLCQVVAGLFIDDAFFPLGGHPPTGGGFSTIQEYFDVPLSCGVATKILAGVYDAVGTITYTEFVLSCSTCPGP